MFTHPLYVELVKILNDLLNAEDMKENLQKSGNVYETLHRTISGSSIAESQKEESVDALNRLRDTLADKLKNPTHEINYASAGFIDVILMSLYMLEMVYDETGGV